MRYPLRVARALDQLANALLGGSEDETFSARAWRHRHRPVWGVAQRTVDFVFYWVFSDANHCEDSFYKEKSRSYLPQIYRNKE